MADNLYVNRNNTTYQVDMENLRSVEDTDLLLVNRDGVTYTVTGDKISTGGGNTGSITTPVEVLTPVNGAGMSDDPITPLSTAITNVGGAGSYVPETSNITDVQQVGINEPYATQVTTTGTVFAGSSPGFMFDGDPNTSFKITGDSKSIYFECEGLPGFDGSKGFGVAIDAAFTSGDSVALQVHYVDGTIDRHTIVSGDLPAPGKPIKGLRIVENSTSLYNLGWKSISVDGVELTGNYSIGSSTELTLENSTNLNLFKQGDLVKGAGGSTQSAAFSTLVYGGATTPLTKNTGIDNTGKALLWFKSINQSNPHGLFDSETGITLKSLSSNTTDAAKDENNGVTAVSNTGFTTGTNQLTNAAPTYDYVVWNFRAAPGFMDIVTYSGDSSSSDPNDPPGAKPHSLNAAPAFIICKSTSNTGRWVVYHKEAGTKYTYMFLDAYGRAQDSGSDLWGTPTDKEFFVSNAMSLNKTGEEYVAYLFADTPGLIKCGTYAGDSGSQTIECGFQPGWLMIKRNTTSTGDWNIFDNPRGLSVGTTGDVTSLLANSASSGQGYRISATNSGFAFNAESAGDVNTAGSTYIYIAIAQDAMAPDEFPPTGALLEDASNSKINLINTTGVWEAGGPVAKGAIDAALELTFQSTDSLDLMVGPVKMTDENGNVKIATTSAISNDSRTESSLWNEGAPSNPDNYYGASFTYAAPGLGSKGFRYIFAAQGASGNTPGSNSQSVGVASSYSTFGLVSENGIDGWTYSRINTGGSNGQPRGSGITYGTVNGQNVWVTANENINSGGTMPSYSYDGDSFTSIYVGNTTKYYAPFIQNGIAYWWSNPDGSGQIRRIMKSTDLENVSTAKVLQDGEGYSTFTGNPNCSLATSTVIMYGGNLLTKATNSYPSGVPATLIYCKNSPGVESSLNFSAIRINDNYVVTILCEGTDSGSGNQVILAAGYTMGTSNGFVYYTYDEGISWNASSWPSYVNPGGIAFGNGKFVATNRNDSGGGAFWESTDGINWTNAGQLTPSNAEEAGSPWNGIGYGNGKFVAITNYQKSPEYDSPSFSQVGRLMYSSDLVESTVEFTDTTEFEYFKEGDTVACSNGASGTLDSDPNLAAKTMDITVTSGTFSNGTTVTGNPVSAGATDVMYVDGNKVGLDGVTPTWLENFFMQGATVTDFGPSPTDVTYTSMNAGSTKYTGIDSNLLSRTWTLQYRAVQTDAWSTVGIYEDTSVVLNQDGSTPWPGAPDLQPNAYYQVKVKYNASNADPVESVYATFKTAAS